MRIITANLNGIRSAHKKGFFDWIGTTNADAVCVQELKAQGTDLTDEMRGPAGYTGHFSYAIEKGYSGVGIYTRRPPLHLRHSLDHPIFDSEGRYIEAEFGDYTVVSLYLPSASSRNPEEQAIKQQKKDEALDVFAEHMRALKASGRSVIICGDWNIAHTEKDIKNAKGNKNSSGFLPHERQWMTDRFQGDGWVDVFRSLYPDEEALGYSWWSNMPGVFAKNVGWRLDYHVATADIGNRAKTAFVYKDVRFSDHSPVVADYAD
ncbi:MAG: exodeoxyribonuclease III [Armatimonadota bacterium]